MSLKFLHFLLILNSFLYRGDFLVVNKLQYEHTSNELHTNQCIKGDKRGICLSYKYCCSGTFLSNSSNCLSNTFCCVGTNICDGCSDGFSKNELNGNCSDINECEVIYGVCSAQSCINLNGSFTCNCSDGYSIKEGSCQLITDEDAILLFTTRSNIRTMKLNGANNSVQTNMENGSSEMTTLYSNLVSTIAIDYDIEGNYLIWSDVSQRKIYMAPLDPTKPNRLNITDKKVFLSNDIFTPDGLAIDWIHHLLYWTDTGVDTINVANILEPENRAIIANITLDEPRAILVNVYESFIVWTDWGINAKIEKACQDGSNRVTLVSENILWPNGISLDTKLERIYWIDAKLSTLSSVDYKGSDRRTLIKSKEVFKHPFNMDIFGDHIYWSDWIYNSVLKINKFAINGEQREIVAQVSSIYKTVRGMDLFIGSSSGSTVMDLKVMHSSQRPNVTNRCVNSMCTHLCVPTGFNSYRCLCPSKKYYKYSEDCNEENDSQSPQTAPPISKQTILPEIAINSTFKTEKTYEVTSMITSQTTVLTSNAITFTTQIPQENVTINKEISEFTSFSVTDNFNNIENDNFISEMLENAKEYNTNGIWIFIATLITLDALIIIGIATIFCRRAKYVRRNINKYRNAIYRKSLDDKLLIMEDENNTSINDHIDLQ